MYKADGRLQAVAVVVDPISTGALLLEEIASRGLAVCCLWSQELRGGRTTSKFLSVEERPTLAETINALNAALPAEIAAVVCGGDDGVHLADALSNHIGKPNCTRAVLGANRRSKHWQQQVVAAAGLRSCRSACGTSWTEEMEHMASLASSSEPVVVKLAEGTGSEGVKVCYAADEARTHFQHLLHAQRRDQSLAAAVVVQEFLDGDEFVVDTVSFGGAHKVVMLWRYDKRPANGSSFVYFGESPLESSSEEAGLLVPYALAVLDAVGILNGPSHIEIKLTPCGNEDSATVHAGRDLSPCLVEVNLRCHGGSGLWVPLSEALCGGHSQVSVTADACLGHCTSFDSLAALPPCPYLSSGAFVCLVSYHGDGEMVTATPGYRTLEGLESFVRLNPMVGIGDKLYRTVDLFTVVAMVILVHSSPDVVAKDVATIRKLEEQAGLFETEGEASRGGSCQQNPKPVRVHRRKIAMGTSPKATGRVSDADAHHVQ